METIAIDEIQINFSEDALVALNILVAFLMFGIALDIRREDFLRLIRSPRIPLVGLLSEYVYLPLLTLLIVWLFSPAASIALGMILLATCPGGSVSNYMVYLSKSNPALSIMLTALTTLLASVITPLAFNLWSGVIELPENLQQTIAVSPWRMIVSVAQLILIPLFIGMLLNERFPNVKTKIEKPVRTVSMILFIGFVIGAVLSNIPQMKSYLGIVFAVVLVHNFLALIGGYGIARAFKLDERNARTISIETGIQNTALGLFLVFNFFEGNGGMALVLAWWGIWHLVSGFGLAMWWRRSAVPEAETA